MILLRKNDSGGQGHGQVKLALLNEILGRSGWAPIVFGCAAPDTGNAEIIAAYGTADQKAKYLQPLLEGEAFSCYSMTEPQGGSDPTQFRCRAQIRYRHEAADAEICVDRERIHVCFDEPQFGVTPGQALVLYDGDRVLGGGWIR